MTATDTVFAPARESFEDLVVWLDSPEAATLTHGELEDQLDDRGRDLLRQMFQAQLELRAVRERRVSDVVCAAGVAHRAVEHGHSRTLATIFGPVEVERLAYRHLGHANCYLADAYLNLTTEVHSHGLRELAAIESTRGSFQQATEAIRRTCGQRVGKRQVESLTAAAACDIEDFYATRLHPPADVDDVLVISADGKGIVMRPDALLHNEQINLSQLHLHLPSARNHSSSLATQSTRTRRWSSRRCGIPTRTGSSNRRRSAMRRARSSASSGLRSR